MADYPVMVVAASMLMAYLTVSAIYNRYLSPLRKIPGPSLNTISWLPWYKYWFSGYMHRHVLRLHETYGPVVRIGPSEISFVDRAAWKDIYSLKRCRQIERDPTSFPALTPNGARFDLLTYSPTGHARYRKILNPCFSDKATREYEPTIHENTDKLVASLSDMVARNGGGGARTNVTKSFQWLTFDMVTDVCWGRSFECLAQQKSHTCLALSMDLVSYSSFVVFVAWWKGLKDFLVKLSGVEGLFVDLVRSQEKLYHQQQLEKPASSDSKSKASIYSHLVAAGDPLNRDELDGNLTAIVIAGSETTGFALTATSYYLAQNPDCFRKAAAEVRSAFASAGDITDDALKKLPYLRAAIEEALRMTPAEPNGLARKVVVDGGLDIAGQWIAQGTAIYVSQFAANRASAHFHLPNEYHPERWLGDPDFADDQLDAVQPFIMGVNVCIGRGLAWMEMRLTLAKLLWHFDWAINDGDGEAFNQSKAWHVWTKSHVHLKFYERGAVHGELTVP